MRNIVITMTDCNYFKYGKKLLETRKNVDADFICYAPDLTAEQLKILFKNDIMHASVDHDLWDKSMQTLKFRFIRHHLTPYTDTGITFVDWDTYFLRDWEHIFNENFSLGITTRTDFIEKDIYHRAWANGGVIFAKRTLETMNLCDMALKCIYDGGHKELPEYDTIWKTLEENRRPEKTHKRTNHRWWCDQMFLSALVMSKKDFGAEFFDCRMYNNLWEETPMTYIMHLKSKSGAGGQLKDGKK